MAQNEDWIPQNMEEFRTFADTFYTKAEAHEIAWNLDADDMIALGELKDIFDPLEEISKHKTSSTPEDNERTIEKRVDYEKLIRKIGTKQMKGNTLMDNADRTSVGVHNDAETHTAAPIAENAPVMSSENKGALAIQVRYTIGEGVKKKALPDGQTAIVIKFGFYKKGEPAPAESACTQTEIISKSPALITFTEDKSGLQFIAYARYINTRKQLGKVASTFSGTVL